MTTLDPGDGYPPFPDGGFEALQRYTSVRVFAEMARCNEEIDEQLLGIPVPRATPTERWANAERFVDRMHAEVAERERQAADLARRIAADPDLARMECAFDAAKEVCRTGHDAGCTYGGMSSAYGYWMAVEDCPEDHADTCALRFACDGAAATTGFIGHEWSGDWIWQAPTCQPCADAYVEKRPEYGPSAPEQDAARQQETEASLAGMRARTPLPDSGRSASDIPRAEHTDFSPALKRALGGLGPFGMLTEPEPGPMPAGVLDAVGFVLSRSPETEWAAAYPPAAYSPFRDFVRRQGEDESRRRSHRSVFIGCHQTDGSWIHGSPHDCPVHARGWR